MRPAGPVKMTSGMLNLWWAALGWVADPPIAWRKANRAGHLDFRRDGTQERFWNSSKECHLRVALGSNARPDMVACFSTGTGGDCKIFVRSEGSMATGTRSYLDHNATSPLRPEA